MKKKEKITRGEKLNKIVKNNNDKKKRISSDFGSFI